MLLHVTPIGVIEQNSEEVSFFSPVVLQLAPLLHPTVFQVIKSHACTCSLLALNQFLFLLCFGKNNRFSYTVVIAAQAYELGSRIQRVHYPPGRLQALQFSQFLRKKKSFGVAKQGQPW